MKGDESVKRGVSYARLSDVRNGDVDGIERQIRENGAHADRLEIEIVEELVDNDLSAAKKKARPAFERLMTGIAANEWDVVVLRSLDRWVRRPDELERIIDAVEASRVEVAAIHGVIDLRTPQGRLLARTMTAVAMHEVEQVTQRVRDWHSDRASRGLPLNGPPGYGYRREKGTSDVTIDPDEADRIHEAARRVIAGDPLRAIAADFTARGIPAPRGSWTGSLVRRILTAPRLIGVRVHHGDEFPGTWPPILDRDTFDRVGRILRSPDRTFTAGADRSPRLLTGIASCGKCEKPLNSRVTHGARRYTCRHCHGVTVYADRLDELVEALVLDVFDTPRLDRAVAQVERVNMADIADEILTLEGDLVLLAAELGDGHLTMPEWKAARTGIDRRLVELRRELAHDDMTSPLEPYAGRPDALRRAWPNLTTAERRTIIAAVLETVIVDPALVGRNRFDPGRVRPVWR